MNRIQRDATQPPGLAHAGAGAAAVLPLRGDCGQNECANTTTSLASTINNPVAGDEQFFTLPVGTTNLMLLLDTSGSMGELPQCGDASFSTNNALLTCRYPTLSTNTGTCDVRGNTNLAWMHTYDPSLEDNRRPRTGRQVDVEPSRPEGRPHLGIDLHREQLPVPAGGDLRLPRLDGDDRDSSRLPRHVFLHLV